MEANSTTWVALGWRPAGYTSACRTWPAVPGTPIQDPTGGSNTGGGTSEPESTLR